MAKKPAVKTYPRTDMQKEYEQCGKTKKQVLNRNAKLTKPSKRK